MKFFIIALLLPVKLFAQTLDRIETPFNRFVKQPDIDWAIYADDTLMIPDAEFGNMLIKKMLQKKIKTAGFLGGGTKDEARLVYRTFDENQEISEGLTQHIPNFDSLGNILPDKSFPRQSATPRIRMYQILFVKAGKLLSTIGYVAPVKVIITPQNDTLGETEFFTALFNKNYQYRQGSKDKTTLLTKTDKQISMDSLKTNDKLKEIFGKNLIQVLWPGIHSGKLKAYSPNSGNPITKAQLITDLLSFPAIEVPVYDPFGNFISKKIMNGPLDPFSFKKIAIHQEWYYNQTKNIVFNRIPYIILYAKKYDENELSPVLKIVFPPEK